MVSTIVCLIANVALIAINRAKDHTHVIGSNGMAKYRAIPKEKNIGKKLK